MAPAAAEVRYGIVGVGMMGREHLHNLAHLAGEVEREQSVRVCVTCLADPHPESLLLGLRLAAELGLPPPQPHHVLVEKPLCTTVQDCKKVIEAAKQRPDILMQVGLEYRYMPPVAKLIDIVKSGTLGQVKMVAIREHRFPFLVKVNNWNRFNCNSGGTLVEKCCHFFDLIRLFADANPVRVMASGAIDVNHKDEVYDGKVPDIIDNAYVIVEFDNGCRGMLDLCMFAEGSKNEQEISVVGDTGKGEAFVPEGIVMVGKRAGGRDGVVTVKAEDERIKYQGLHHGSSYLEHLNFLSAIRAQGACSPAISLDDGLLSVAIGVAGQLSIEKGRFVTIEEMPMVSETVRGYKLLRVTEFEKEASVIVLNATGTFESEMVYACEQEAKFNVKHERTLNGWKSL
ncbi:Putative oxidoreductase yteT [Triticum urartu]|uniref:Putative oxidoreductase yteT n=1 Tax=Triticum urartu TaxID=4572 RepID=M7YNQ4_TRIUA|nr:Putative oxidoreductase yteT [Triticum urartu]